MLQKILESRCHCLHCQINVKLFKYFRKTELKKLICKKNSVLKREGELWHVHRKKWVDSITNYAKIVFVRLQNKKGIPIETPIQYKNVEGNHLKKADLKLGLKACTKLGCAKFSSEKSIPMNSSLLSSQNLRYNLMTWNLEFLFDYFEVLLAICRRNEECCDWEPLWKTWASFVPAGQWLSKFSHFTWRIHGLDQVQDANANQLVLKKKSNSEHYVTQSQLCMQNLSKNFLNQKYHYRHLGIFFFCFVFCWINSNES